MSEANQNERMVKPDFPICGTGKKIPWSVAERAYEGYVKLYGRGQTLERLAERGGFHANEMDQLYPAWREEVEEVYLLRKEVEQMEKQNATIILNAAEIAANQERACKELMAENRRYRDALERIGNVMSTVPALTLDPEDESDLANSQGALFEIAVITEQALSVQRVSG